MRGDFRLGEWLIQPQLNRIKGSGGKTRGVEPKAMEVLVYLSKHSEEVLPKERIIQAVWPDTFVTDDVLSHAISELRKAFGDDAKNPRVIETIQRRGYRLIATVEFEGISKETGSGLYFVGGRKTVWLALCIAVVLIFAGTIVIFQRWIPLTGLDSDVVSSFRAAPFTSDPGHEITPDFSPLGDRIAFSWRRSDQNKRNWDIYVQQIGPGDPFPLVTHPEDDMVPQWSPDGQEIAFARVLSDKITILTIPSLGGSERTLAEIGANRRFDLGFTGIAWSPDRNRIAVSYRPEGEKAARVYLLSVDTREMEQATFPPAETYGDYHVKFSPDGQTIAFFRRADYSNFDLYLQSLGDVHAKRLTFESFAIGYGLAWMPDGQEIVFSAGSIDYPNISRVPLDGGEPIPFMAYGENLQRKHPAVSPKGDRLAYVESIPNQGDIWRIANPRVNPSDQDLHCLISSTRDDMQAFASPDGSRIAFLSNRTGNSEIYVCNSDGSQPRPLTQSGAGPPSWSPDSSQISFHARLEGSNDIYIVSAEGGQPHPLTKHPGDDIVPNWSLNGQSIYFASNRTGEYQTWKIPKEGGEATQITRQGGHFARESSDGYLYYTRGNPGEIWKTPVGGGEETLVLEKVLHRWNWSLGSEGIYFTTDEKKGDLYEWRVRFLEFKSGDVKETLVRDLPLNPGDFAVSPDEQWFFVVLNTPPGSRDLMLVENFR